MTHAKLIDDLGGQAALARLFGRHKSAVNRWASRGIPPHAYPVILDMAAKAGIRLTLQQLADASPRFGRRGTARNRLRVA